MRFYNSDKSLIFVPILTKVSQASIIIIVEVAFMKKKNIISLIRYHAEKNEAGFRNEAYEIAKDFDEAGDYQLAVKC